MKRAHWLLTAALSAVVVSGAAAGVYASGGSPVTGAKLTAEQSAIPQGDGPGGFWFGSDSWPMPVTGHGPYNEPVTGGSYGGYVGMAGNWASWLGCSKGNFLAWAPANSNEANINQSKYGKGIGTALYWYMGGPGVDPHYNGTAKEASAWGARQAARTLTRVGPDHMTYPVIWADIELPGIAPAPDNGWNTVYTTPCSGRVKQQHIPAAVDRAVFNGYASYITTHSHYKVGVYSAPVVWTAIFGTGTASKIPNTYEWTYEPETTNFNHAPYGWCLRGTHSCAAFFGGQTSASKYALMWQWSGGGGVSNGIGDFDQIDKPRMR